MTQEPYTVSILVPVYGVEKYIERCARSIFEQTYKNLDIVFVDDCTPDKSIEILKRVLDDYPERKEQTRIIRHEKNGGLSVARNTAMSVASGDYFYFVDSDDTLSRDCIENLTIPLRNEAYDLVLGGYVVVSDKSAQGENWILKEGACRNNDILTSLCLEKWYVQAWNKLFNSKLYRMDHLEFYPGIINEDNLWSFCLALKAKSMYVVNQSTYYYYLRPGSIMSNIGKKAKEAMRSNLIIYRELCNLTSKYHLYGMLYENYLGRTIWLLNNAMDSLGYDSYSTYKTIREEDPRTLGEQWKICFSPRFHIGFLDRLFPARIGYVVNWMVNYLFHFWTRVQKQVKFDKVILLKNIKK